MQELVAYLTEHNKIVTDLEYDIDQYREIDKQHLKRIAELEGLVSDLECDVHFWKTKAALTGEAK